MIRDSDEYRLVVKLILTASLPFIAVVFLYIKRWQHRWMKEFDFSPLIEEELQRLGLELVEIRNPTRHEAQNSPLPPPQGLRVVCLPLALRCRHVRVPLMQLHKENRERFKDVHPT